MLPQLNCVSDGGSFLQMQDLVLILAKQQLD
jgi:hypothetical protein